MCNVLRITSPCCLKWAVEKMRRMGVNVPGESVSQHGDCKRPPPQCRRTARVFACCEEHCKRHQIFEEKWCPKADSNHRHSDFQSLALPTELFGHPRFRVIPVTWSRAYRQRRGGLSSQKSAKKRLAVKASIFVGLSGYGWVIALVTAGAHGDAIILVKPGVQITITASARAEGAEFLRRRFATQRAGAWLCRGSGFGRCGRVIGHGQQRWRIARHLPRPPVVRCGGQVR